METKTKIAAKDQQQDLVITREFELPVALLFRAFTEAKLVEQWMGTKVLKLESKPHGSYQFETSSDGNVVFRANGTIHDLVPNKSITRTFEMENVPIGVQLEFLEFERSSDTTSKLTMHIIYRSVEHRAAQLKLPFKQGLNMAHNRLEEILSKLK